MRLCTDSGRRAAARTHPHCKFETCLSTARSTLGVKRRSVNGRKTVIGVNVDQLAPDGPRSPDCVFSVQAWKDDYPWLQQALTQIGPGARDASDGWRVRIQDELKTTLDFKIRPDGTAAVWCGMSGYDFRHDPTPKELFEGLGKAYRRELERVGGSNPWKMSAGARLAPAESVHPRSPVPTLPTPAEDSLPRTLGALFLPRAEQLMLIFLGATALTLALSAVALAVR